MGVSSSRARNCMPGSQEQPEPVNLNCTAEQMQIRRQLREMNTKRMAAFDDKDIDGCMKDFLPKGQFIINSPNADPVVMEGFEAIKGLEIAFKDGIAENFGQSYHELCLWKWESIEAESATCRVYTKLWLTNKATGEWMQQDLSGKSGRFWLVMNHVKVGEKWFLESQVAESED